MLSASSSGTGMPLQSTHISPEDFEFIQAFCKTQFSSWREMISTGSFYAAVISQALQALYEQKGSVGLCLLLNYFFYPEFLHLFSPHMVDVQDDRQKMRNRLQQSLFPDIVLALSEKFDLLTPEFDIVLQTLFASMKAHPYLLHPFSKGKMAEHLCISLWRANRLDMLQVLCQEGIIDLYGRGQRREELLEVMLYEAEGYFPEKFNLICALLSHRILDLEKSALSARDKIFLTVFQCDVEGQQIPDALKKQCQQLASLTLQDNHDQGLSTLLAYAISMKCRAVIDLFVELNVLKFQGQKQENTAESEWLESEFHHTLIALVNNALNLAIRGGDIDFTHYLLSKGFLLDNVGFNILSSKGEYIVPLLDWCCQITPLQVAAFFGEETLVELCLNTIKRADLLTYWLRDTHEYTYLASEVSQAALGYHFALVEKVDASSKEKTMLREKYARIIRMMMCDQRWPGVVGIDFNDELFFSLMQDKAWLTALSNKPLLLCDFPQGESYSLFKAALKSPEEISSWSHQFQNNDLILSKMEDFLFQHFSKTVVEEFVAVSEKAEHVCYPYYALSSQNSFGITQNIYKILRHTSDEEIPEDVKKISKEILTLRDGFYVQYEHVVQMRHHLKMNLMKQFHDDGVQYSRSVILSRIISTANQFAGWNQRDIRQFIQSLEQFFNLHPGFVGVDLSSIRQIFNSSVELKQKKSYIILLASHYDADMMMAQVVDSLDACLSLLNASNDPAFIRQLGADFVQTVSEIITHPTLSSELGLDDVSSQALNRWALSQEGVVSVVDHRVMMLSFEHYQRELSSRLPFIQVRTDEEGGKCGLVFTISYGHDLLSTCDIDESFRAAFERCFTTLMQLDERVLHVWQFNQALQESSLVISTHCLAILSDKQQAHLFHQCMTMIKQADFRVRYSNQLELFSTDFTKMQDEFEKSSLLVFAKKSIEMLSAIDARVKWCEQCELALLDHQHLLMDKISSGMIKYRNIFAEQIQALRLFITEVELYQTEINLLIKEKACLEDDRDAIDQQCLKLLIEAVEQLKVRTHDIRTAYRELSTKVLEVQKNDKFKSDLANYDHESQCVVTRYEKVMQALWCFDHKQPAEVRPDVKVKGKAKSKQKSQETVDDEVLPVKRVPIEKAALSLQKLQTHSPLWFQTTCFLAIHRMVEHNAFLTIETTMDWYVAAQRLQLLFFAESASQFLTPQSPYFRFYQRLANSVVHASYFLDQDPELWHQLPGRFRNLSGYLKNHISRSPSCHDDRMALLRDVEWYGCDLEQPHITRDGLVVALCEIFSRNALPVKSAELQPIFNVLLLNIRQHIDALSDLLNGAHDENEAMLYFDAFIMRLVDLGEIAARMRNALLIETAHPHGLMIDKKLHLKIDMLEPVILLRNRVRHELHMPTYEELDAICQRILPVDSQNRSLSMSTLLFATKRGDVVSDEPQKMAAPFAPRPGKRDGQ